MSNLRLNKDQQINITEIKGGIKTSFFEEDVQCEIFKAFNSGKVDNILDNDEINLMLENLFKYAKDGNLSKKEAEKLLKSLNLTNVTADDLFAFLNNVLLASAEIESSEVLVSENNNRFHITYKNGNQEFINFDGSYEMQVFYEENVSKKGFFDAEGTLFKEEFVDGDMISTIYYENNLPVRRINNQNNEGKITETIYSDGEPVSVKITEGSSVSYGEYVDGEFQLRYKIEEKGLPIERITDFEVCEDGKIRPIKTTCGNAVTNYEYKGDLCVATTIDGDVEIVEKSIGNNVFQSEVFNKSTNTRIITTYRADGSRFVIERSDNREAFTFYNSEGFKTTEQVYIGRKCYRANYDGNGNTIINRDNSETNEQIATTFECNVSDIRRVDRGRIRNWANEELIVPGEFAADSPEIRNRTSKEEVSRIYKTSLDHKTADLILSKFEPFKILNKTGAKTYEELANFILEQIGYPPVDDKKYFFDRLVQYLKISNLQYNSDSSIQECKKAYQLLQNKPELVDNIATHPLLSKVFKENPNLVDGKLEGKEIDIYCPLVYANYLVREEIFEQLEEQRKQKSEEVAQSLYNQIYKTNVVGFPVTADDLDRLVFEATALADTELVMEYYSKLANGDSDDEVSLIGDIIEEYGQAYDTCKEYVGQITRALNHHANSGNIYFEDVNSDINAELKALDDDWWSDGDRLDAIADRYQRRTIITQNFYPPEDILNGKIDENFYQGHTGNCWLISVIKGLSMNPKGLEILNNSLKLNDDGSVTVTLKGVDKTYTISKEELYGRVEHAIGDADVRAIEIAFEKYFTEERSSLSVYSGDDTEGNTENLAYKILTGDNRFNWSFIVTESSWDDFLPSFNNKNSIITVGANNIFQDKSSRTIKGYELENSKHINELPTQELKDAKKEIELYTEHSYLVNGVDFKQGLVFLINPHDTSTTIAISVEDFKMHFNNISSFKL